MRPLEGIAYAHLFGNQFACDSVQITHDVKLARDPLPRGALIIGLIHRSTFKGTPHRRAIYARNCELTLRKIKPQEV